MSKVRSDNISNRADDGAPALVYGVEVPVGYGITGAGGVNITGIATAASFSGATGSFSGQVVIGGDAHFLGKIGIGTNDPEDLLHLESGNSGAGSLTQAQLVLESSGSSNWIHFKNKNNQNAGLAWSDPDSTEVAKIYYDHNTDNLEIAADDDTIFKTNATERLRITSDGYVSIGVASPQGGAQLTIAGKGIAITGQNTDHGANSMRLGEEGSGLAQIRCYGPDASTNGSLTLRSDTSNGSNSLDVSLLSNGNLSISDGNLVVASGHGIDFSAGGNAGGMSSEVLDDYEEGTWSPGVGGSATYTGTPEGTYTKVGRLVYVTCNMTINAIGTGSVTVISPLPFASTGGLENSSAVGYWSTLSRNVTSLMACTNSSQVVFTDTTSATSGSGLNSGVFQNGTNIRFSLCYQTNA